MIAILGRKDLGTGILRNLTNGGDGASGAVRSEETKKKDSESKIGEKNPMFGVPHTEEWKKAISERNSGEKHPRSKAIIAVKPDGTELHFGSVHEAARELTISRGKLSGYLNTGHVLTQGPRKGWQFRHENPVGVL